jgi:hypothetical protein
MKNKVTIIIEGYDGRLESEFVNVYEQHKNKKILISKLKEQLQDVLDNEYSVYGLTLNDFEFTIYEDLTEKYKDV